MRNLWIMTLALVAIGVGITAYAHAETVDAVRELRAKLAEPFDLLSETREE